MKTSIYTPKGLHEYRAGKPLAQGLHETALQLFSRYGAERGGFSTEPGSLVDLFTFAMAITFARVARANQNVDRERSAAGAYYLLKQFEEEYGLTPSGDDTLVDRREALALAKRAARGNTRQEIEQQLRDLLGDDYVGLHIPVGAEIAIWPADLGDAPQLLADATSTRKLVRITNVIIDGLGAPQAVHYQAVDPAIVAGEQHSLAVNDRLVVEPELLARAEVVVVTSLGLDGSTPTFTATFENAHEPNVWATQMPFPAWASWGRHLFVALAADAAIDPETRRKTHVLLGKILPAITTWSVCPLSGAGTIGPFTLDDPVLGRLNINPMTVLTVP